MSTYRIKQIEEYIEKFFRESNSFENEYDKKYRLEHSYRVANIGRFIAENEGLDAEALIAGCLLHDISYAGEFSGNDYRNHGRDSAEIARPLLEELGFTSAQVNEICYGIAIHVDGNAEFQGERTPLAQSIEDADNIDRFDAYRIYDNLRWKKYNEISLDEKNSYVCNALEKLNSFKSVEFGTATAKRLWIDKLDFQLEFYSKLKRQIDMSTIIVNAEKTEIRQITDNLEKSEVTRTVLEALPEWFEIPEAREEYIRDSKDKLFFCAYDAGAPAGFLYLKETGKDTVELAVMGVLKEYHRKGIGTKLFNAAKETANALGYFFIQVKTVQMGKYEEYDQTNQFYISLGFMEFEVFPKLWDEWNPCQIYVMALK